MIVRMAIEGGGEKAVAPSCAAITFWPQQIGVRGFRRQDTGFAMSNRLQTVYASRLRRRRRQQEQQGHVGHILRSCAQATKFSTAVDRVLHLQLY